MLNVVREYPLSGRMVLPPWFNFFFSCHPTNHDAYCSPHINPEVLCMSD
jgi:hypothetical protein